MKRIFTILTPSEMESSVGNFKINLLPAFSSLEFNGRIRATTLILQASSAVGAGVASGSAILLDYHDPIGKETMEVLCWCVNGYSSLTQSVYPP